MTAQVSFRCLDGVRRVATVQITTDHSASSYSQPVVVGEDGEAVDVFSLQSLDYRLVEGQSSEVRAAWDAVAAQGLAL